MEEEVGTQEVGVDKIEHLEHLSLVLLQLWLQLLSVSVSHYSGWQVGGDSGSDTLRPLRAACSAARSWSD